MCNYICYSFYLLIISPANIPNYFKNQQALLINCRACGYVVYNSTISACAAWVVSLFTNIRNLLAGAPRLSADISIWSAG